MHPMCTFLMETEMTEIEKIKAFKASDGKVFENQDDALNHQTVLDFHAEVELDWDHPTSADCLQDWLNKNQTLVEKYYSSRMMLDSKSKRAADEAKRRKRNARQ